MRCLRTQIKRHRSKGFFSRANGQKILVKARLIVMIEKTPGPLHAMPADQQMPAVGIAQERGHARSINDDFNRIEPA